MNRAGWSVRSTAFRIEEMSEVTPVAVSLWTTQTARICFSRSAFSSSSTFSGLTPSRQFPGIQSTCNPSFSASCFHRVPKCPVSNINTLSPGERVFTKADSHAPVPEAGKMITGFRVLKTSFNPSKSSRHSPLKSGPR